MAENLSLIEFIRELLDSSDMQSQFREDPSQTLDAVGFGHIDAHDVRDALTLVSDDSQHADFSREYNTGFHGDLSGAGAPPPHPHESAAHYVHRYVTNTFTDDRDTVVDHSVNQQVDTLGGDFDQDIDVNSTTASGDGSVAAGADIVGSAVTTGHDNQIGDGNVKGDGNVAGDGNQAVTGDHNTTAFGQGNASGTDVGGDLKVGDGGAFASGGAASVNNSDDSAHGSGNAYTDASTHEAVHETTDNSISHSGNAVTDDSATHSNNVANDADYSNVGNDHSDNSFHFTEH